MFKIITRKVHFTSFFQSARSELLEPFFQKGLLTNYSSKENKDLIQKLVTEHEIFDHQDQIKVSSQKLDIIQT